MLRAAVRLTQVVEIFLKSPETNKQTSKSLKDNVSPSFFLYNI